MLQLADKKPLANGGERLVFEHPEHDEWLVKVANPHSKKSKRPQPFYKRLRRLGPFQPTGQEVLEHMALRVTCPERPKDWTHVQNIIGFADTDMGLGIVVEAVRGANGDLAPTLRQLHQDGRLDDHVIDGLEQFFDWLLHSKVIINDLHLDNLVLSQSGRVVMIDGLGDRHLIPIKAYSQRFNRHHKQKKIERLRQKLGLS